MGWGTRKGGLGRQLRDGLLDYRHLRTGPPEPLLDFQDRKWQVTILKIQNSLGGIRAQRALLGWQRFAVQGPTSGLTSAGPIYLDWRAQRWAAVVRDGRQNAKPGS